MARRSHHARFGRWDPHPYIQELRREMDILFDRTLGRSAPSPAGNGSPPPWLPDADFVDLDKHYLVRMDLPGLDRDDIEVTLTNNVLTIQGERTIEAELKDESVHVGERRCGRFLRRFELPLEVDAENVHAKMKKGVLELRLPKVADSKARRIAVQS